MGALQQYVHRQYVRGVTSALLHTLGQVVTVQQDVEVNSRVDPPAHVRGGDAHMMLFKHIQRCLHISTKATDN